MEAIRHLANDWATTLLAVIALATVMGKASRTARVWWNNINLWRRVHVLEVAVDELESASHAQGAQSATLPIDKGVI